ESQPARASVRVPDGFLAERSADGPGDLGGGGARGTFEAHAPASPQRTVDPGRMGRGRAGGEDVLAAARPDVADPERAGTVAAAVAGGVPGAQPAGGGRLS